jgi:hypothetical protein
VADESQHTPVRDALKSKVNLTLVTMGAVMVIDLLCAGNRIMISVLQMQSRLFGIDPASEKVKIVTLFGTFDTIESAARAFDISLAIIFLGIPLLSYIRALIGTLREKRFDTL